MIAAQRSPRSPKAHINPAVTLGFWALGRLNRADVVGYDSPQTAGGLADAVFARAIVPVRAASAIGNAVTHPSVPTRAALALEEGVTAAPGALIFALVSTQRRARWTPVAETPLLVAIIWPGHRGPGAPARSAGPTVAFEDVADLWIYLAGPSAAALAVGVGVARCSNRSM